MGTGALSSLGVRALAASYAQLHTTGHNISNANTPGYSRQEAQLQTAGGQFTGAGFFGRGVDVTTVARGTRRARGRARGRATSRGRSAWNLRGKEGRAP